MTLAGAIFDMDGTLIDSMHVWNTIGERYLRSKGINPDIFINETVTSLPLSYAASYIQRKYGIKDSPEQVRADMDRILETFYRQEVCVKEGVTEFLNVLKEDGIPMCVATATRLPSAMTALEKTGLRPYFRAVLSCHTIKRSKQYPDIYELALKELRTKKEKTVVFEDALYAARTAKKAGFPLVGVFDQSEKEQEKLVLLADLFLKSFTDIRACEKDRKRKYDTKEKTVYQDGI